MKKFPVTSKNGNEYLVEVCNWDGMVPFDSVRIYKKKKFLKFQYNKKIYDKKFYWDDKLYHNYKDMVEKTIEIYEESTKEQRFRKEFEQKKFEELNEWDGIIK